MSIDCGISNGCSDSDSRLVGPELETGSPGLAELVSTGSTSSMCTSEGDSRSKTRLGPLSVAVALEQIRGSSSLSDIGVGPSVDPDDFVCFWLRSSFKARSLSRVHLKRWLIPELGSMHWKNSERRQKLHLRDSSSMKSDLFM